MGAVVPTPESGKAIIFQANTKFFLQKPAAENGKNEITYRVGQKSKSAYFCLLSANLHNFWHIDTIGNLQLGDI